MRHLSGEGFRVITGDDDRAVLHHRKLSITRFGFVDSVVVIRSTEGQATRSDLVEHEEAAIAEALRLKVWLPRGFFSAVEVFPVILASDADGDAVQFVHNNLRNRWALMSMPAVVHDGGKRVETFRGRKLWGGAYVGDLRSRLLRWLAWGNSCGGAGGRLATHL